MTEKLRTELWDAIRTWALDYGEPAATHVLHVVAAAENEAYWRGYNEGRAAAAPTESSVARPATPRGMPDR